MPVLGRLIDAKITEDRNNTTLRADDIIAEKVYKNVLKNVPASFKSSNIMKCLKITKIYKSPTDGGINTKVRLYGYFKNKRGVVTPAPLVGNVFEYGSSKQSKRPFFRKSFRKAEIEAEMKKVQEKYLPKE